jgi:DNA modification methylase
VDEGMVIICGHTRWKAARKLGLAKVPVHVATDLTPEQVKAYRIADNKTGELAEWNMDLLPIEIADLQAADWDMGQFGFTAEELSKLLEGDLQEGLTDPDDVPAPPDEAITRRGDLIILGEHRLLCGDSGSAEDLDRLLDGSRIHMVNTDPPYNVKVEPRSNNAIAAGLSSFEGTKTDYRGEDGHRGKRKGLTHHQQSDVDRNGVPQATHRKLRAKDRALLNDFVSDEAFAGMLRAWFGNITRVLEPGRCFYIWGGYSNISNYPPALVEAGLYFSQMIIWDKQHPVMTRKDYMGAHEWCFYGWKEGAAHQFFGPANETDLWHVKKVTPQKMIHLTEKPVELAVRAIRNSSLQGENVLDLFGGSGSTLIACEQSGRKAFLMELDPLYCDVIVQRYEQFTGKKAERVRAGKATEVTA